MAGNGHHNTSVINKLSQGKWVLETAAKPHCNTVKRLPNSSRRSLHVFFAGSRPLSYSVSMVFVGWTLVISPVFPWNLPMFFSQLCAHRGGWCWPTIPTPDPVLGTSWPTSGLRPRLRHLWAEWPRPGMAGPPWWARSLLRRFLPGFFPGEHQNSWDLWMWITP